MTPCSTLEQRWSVCRGRMRVAADWEAQWGDTPMLDMFRCTIWREWEIASHRRPCTSPRRNQCRAGLSHASDLRRFEHERAHGYWFPHPPVFIGCRDRLWRAG